MIDSKGTILSKLEQLHKENPASTIMYEFYSLSQTHVVFVSPESFSHSSSVCETEHILEDYLFNNFPNQSILFISDDSLNQINSPELHLKSKEKELPEECVARLLQSFDAPSVEEELVYLLKISKAIFHSTDHSTDFEINTDNTIFALAA